MIPSRPSDADDAATEPIADLPLFSEEEIGSAADAPMDEGEALTSPVARPDTATPTQDTLPIEPETRPVEAEPAVGEAWRAAPIGRRFQAAALDAIVLLATLVSLIAGALLLGAPADVASLPYYLPTWLLFSFLYHVIPLMFWGRTPGMAYIGVFSRGTSGEPLTVGQAVRRWLVAMATLGLCGVPGLAALSGRSLADRVSHSSTLAT